MELKVYADRMSQPWRAILIFCKMNGIQFEEIKIDLSKEEHKSFEYKVMQFSCILPVHFLGSPNIGIYERKNRRSSATETCSLRYPADLVKRAKVQSVLDWHHSNLRRGSVMYLLNTVFGPFFGITPNPQAAAEAEKMLSSSLSIIESYWLEEEGKFLLGGLQPSLADLCLVCEIMEHEKATNPHFEEVHETLYGVKARFQEQLAVNGSKEQ